MIRILHSVSNMDRAGIETMLMNYYGLIALPPLAEQKRIVAKIEELLPLVDRYAVAYEKLEQFNAKFPEDMKKSILQYAIQGKLVEQRPEEGTGEELYQQIQTEKQRLIKEGKIKKEKPLPEIAEDEKPYDIPDNWTWVRFGDLGSYKKGPFGSAITKSMFVPKGNGAIKVYEQKNAIQKDATLGDYYIRRDYFESKMKGFEVFPGDIIVSCAGTIGETYVMPDKFEQGIINQALMRMKIFEPLYIPYFLTFFDFVLKKNARSGSKGSAIKNIPPFEIHDIENDEVVELPRLYNTIGAMFSRPYNGDASKYLSTQYIAEEIKNMGFDGLRFRSSLNKNGYNIVLFNPDDCVAVSSDLVEVKGIDLKLDEPMIYKVGTPKLKEEMTNLDWMK